VIVSPSPGLVNASQAFTPLPTNGRGSSPKLAYASLLPTFLVAATKTIVQ
jgi:hypothetical protein